MLDMAPFASLRATTAVKGYCGLSGPKAVRLA